MSKNRLAFLGKSGKPGIAAAFLFLLICIPVVASWPEFFNRTADKKWSQAERVVRTLALKKGQNVADIGAGGGYFSVLLAREVGPRGTVYAVDISKKCIAYIRQYTRNRNVSNVEPVLAAADDPGLEKNSIDLVFTRNTYHHIENRVAYFRRLKKALKPGGRVAIIDYHPRIYANHSTPENVIYGEMAAAGYRKDKRYTFLSRQNFNIFVVE